MSEMVRYRNGLRMVAGGMALLVLALIWSLI